MKNFIITLLQSIGVELSTYKASPKSRTFYVRIGERSFDLEVNWHSECIIFRTTRKGEFSKQLFNLSK